jgi:hypothetical protein
MKFMILMADGAGAWDRLGPTDQAEVFRKHEEFGRALRREAKFIASGRLASAADARTVCRDAAGRATVSDGPYAETKEVLGGFYLIEAESLDGDASSRDRTRYAH